MAIGGSEQELVDALHRDDPAALAALFDRHGDRIYNHCFRQLGSWSEAEDATSSVFLEVWRHRRRVRPALRQTLVATPYSHGSADPPCACTRRRCCHTSRKTVAVASSASAQSPVARKQW